ncbi:hypothetical protein [Bacteroides sp.]
MAENMSLTNVISFWHAVCFLIVVRLEDASEKGMGQQPDKKKLE